MEERKPLVTVLSRNYSTGLSVIRSLGAAGYTVDLVASAYKKGTSDIAACSKYVRNKVEVVSPKVKAGKDKALLKALLKFAEGHEEKTVLFPTDDYTTSIMDMNREVLAEHYIMPTIVDGGNGCLTERMDKTVQAEMAKEAGLLVPQEWIISLEHKIEIPEEMVYPCFCKPIESVTGYKKEMAVCRSRRALRDHLKKLRKAYRHRSILVQEFLQIDNEIDLSGVCLDQEIIIPAVIKKLNVAQYERGVTLAGRIIPFAELGDLQEKIVHMLRQFHYVGMFDMELNVVGDKIYFNEVNLRSGGPNYAYFKSGVNLPALYVKEAMGQKHAPEEEKVSAYGKSFIYEKVAWEDHMHGYMTRKELEARIAAADIRLLYNDEDPAPGKLFIKTMKKTVRNQKIKKSGIYKWYKKTEKKVNKVLKKWKRKLHRTARKIKRSVRKTFYPPLRAVKHTLMGYPQMKKENIANPFSEKPRVVVAGRNYCSNLCMARSLGEAGYEVEILRVFQVKPKWTNVMKQMKPDAYSKYVKAFHICIANRKASRVVKKLISIADPYRKMLLIPADDLVANIADEHMKKLSKYYVLPNVDGKKNGINNLMSKEAQKELAKAAGLPIVNSALIRVKKRGEVEIPETVTYPCFIKPNISKNSSKSRMRRIESEEELIATLKEFSRHKEIEMLVEDYLEIEREYSMLGLAAKETVISPGFFGALEGGHDERRGVAMTGQILPCEQEKELIDSIIQFIATLNFEGLFDVDLIQTKDGKMYFVELNMRFGASGYAVTQSGANLPGMFADYMLLGKPVDSDCKIEKAGKTFISEKVMLEEYIKSYLDKSGMHKHMADVDVHFIQNAQDPKPYQHFKKFYTIAALNRKYNEMKGTANH